MEDRLDLFALLADFLAVEPLGDKFDLEKAESVIKEDKKDTITFIGDHAYFEQSIGVMVEKIINVDANGGTAYIYVKGRSTVDRIVKRIMDISIHSEKVIIFGDDELWPRMAGNINFSEKEDIFEDNHQRFFIYQSPDFNVALVARHKQENGQEIIEAAVTVEPDAVSMLASKIGRRIF